MARIHLVIIDPQVDFCDPKGALYVRGAEEDVKRLASFVRRMGDKLAAIHCTLDNHHLIDIAHPSWWQDRHGHRPAPFTIIRAGEVERGDWTTSLPCAQARSLAYVKALAAGGRYPLCIWPPHCLIGSRGATVMPELFDVFLEWEARGHRMVDYTAKGANPWTEHYSAVQADVPDPTDPCTMLNRAFIQTLEKADTILLSGEAGSHCLANTVRDVANNFAKEDYVKKFVLLEDTTSPVPGFEEVQSTFIREMRARGMQVTTTRNYA